MLCQVGQHVLAVRDEWLWRALEQGAEIGEEAGKRAGRAEGVIPCRLIDAHGGGDTGRGRWGMIARHAQTIEFR